MNKRKIHPASASFRRAQEATMAPRAELANRRAFRIVRPVVDPEWAVDMRLGVNYLLPDTELRLREAANIVLGLVSEDEIAKIIQYNLLSGRHPPNVLTQLIYRALDPLSHDALDDVKVESVKTKPTTGDETLSIALQVSDPRLSKERKRFTANIEERLEHKFEWEEHPRLIRLGALHIRGIDPSHEEIESELKSMAPLAVKLGVADGAKIR